MWAFPTCCWCSCLAVVREASPSCTLGAAEAAKFVLLFRFKGVPFAGAENAVEQLSVILSKTPSKIPSEIVASLGVYGKFGSWVTTCKEVGAPPLAWNMPGLTLVHSFPLGVLMVAGAMDVDVTVDQLRELWLRHLPGGC